jgi:hypothetical protein
MAEDDPRDATTEFLVGGHLFRWEPPDIGYLAYHGDLDDATAAILSEKARRFTLGKPRVFLLVDMSKMGKIATGARRRSAEGAKDLAMRGTAVVGASAHLRIIAGLVTRAIDLLYDKADNPTRFFATESEARAWIAERRRALGVR